MFIVLCSSRHVFRIVVVGLVDGAQDKVVVFGERGGGGRGRGDGRSGRGEVGTGENVVFDVEQIGACCFGDVVVRFADESVD